MTRAAANAAATADALLAWLRTQSRNDGTAVGAESEGRSPEAVSARGQATATAFRMQTLERKRKRRLPRVKTPARGMGPGGPRPNAEPQRCGWRTLTGCTTGSP